MYRQAGIMKNVCPVSDKTNHADKAAIVTCCGKEKGAGQRDPVSLKTAVGTEANGLLKSLHLLRRYRILHLVVDCHLHGCCANASKPNDPTRWGESASHGARPSGPGPLGSRS